MNKWEVTFKFKSCMPTVLVLAGSAEDAVEKARERDYPPVPQYIKASVVQLGRGGYRSGAGRKAGSGRVKIKRELRRNIMWTPSEWLRVEEKAKAAGFSVAEYQRMKILTGKD